MGYGDEIIGTGLARGARVRGKRVAFGDGRKIFWSSWAPVIFKNNPNVAPPGSEGASDLEWIDHYKGSRKYNRFVNGKWEWNYGFRVTPGEFFFTFEEKALSEKYDRGFVVMEPNVPWQKRVASNKDWGANKYEAVARHLMAAGKRVVQFQHANTRRVIEGAQLVQVPDLRQAAAIVSRAALYVGPEGGMHHTAAAVGVRAVVLFGGFIPPSVVGYENHVSLTGGAQFCGNIEPCQHCRDAMDRISVQLVTEASFAQLEKVSHDEM